ncbi:amidohydrolase family protein [Belliella kenyensis]|uniref:Amidohydrolase family protein n=1 Tax=Belliella kenyensis TaxID=1472724 RepID=A0ABV8EP61_9BACT|nr:amidohydrolase family protein [Belliella kenyensis]MCH7402863.1 amidohydrolase family protein [Belliella kenyensis]MDN3602569.1 amidohydrolase family protein [Belliella kenyensis]
MKMIIQSSLLILLICSFCHVASGQESVYYIYGAEVYDGRQTSPRKLNVLVSGDRILKLDTSQISLEGYKDLVKINAEGLILAPGFIDPHTHLESDLSHVERKSNLSALYQGVTTVIAGNDGGSPFPIERSFRQWSENGIGTNVALFVGHGTVRRLVLGPKDIQPTEDELQRMKDMVSQAMEEGAIGLSTGLFYAPGSYAKTDEVVALAAVAASYGGVYDTHIRDESSYSIGLIESIKETLEIGRRTGIPLHFSHIKALGADVWGLSDEVIQMIEDAKSDGLEITANQYPYIASRTSMVAALIPRWAEDGGYDALLERLNDDELHKKILVEVKENIRRRGGSLSLIVSAEDLTAYHDLSLEVLSEKLHLPAEEVVVKILKEAGGVRVVSFNMKEDDLTHFMRQEWVFTGSDGVVGHPRKFGSYARKIQKYVLEEQVISLGEMIKKSTFDIAFHLGLPERGEIKEGNYADLILFDPNQVKENATFQNPSAFSEGMKYVFVNGQIAIDKGEYTGVLAGVPVKRQ